MEHTPVDTGFAERLKQVVQDHGSSSALAAAIGRSEGAVRKWLRGLSEPNVSDLRSICEVTNTSVEWLVTGVGPRGTQQSLELKEGRGDYLAGAKAVPPILDEKWVREVSQVVAETVVRLVLKKSD